MPRWEELLLFNDNFETVFEMEKNKNVVMFFEIIDFLPMSVANKNYNRYGQKGGWYRIAWAFLKLVDADWRSSRFGQKVRLQMFKPHLKVMRDYIVTENGFIFYHFSRRLTAGTKTLTSGISGTGGGMTS